MHTNSNDRVLREPGDINRVLPNISQTCSAKTACINQQSMFRSRNPLESIVELIDKAKVL